MNSKGIRYVADLPRLHTLNITFDKIIKEVSEKLLGHIPRVRFTAAPTNKELERGMCLLLL